MGQPIKAKMTNLKKSIKLSPFQEADFALLCSQIPDARFLLQWAGPKYKFPLTYEQIAQRDNQTIDNKKSIYIFNAVACPTNKIIGFIELVLRDFSSMKVIVESVIIFNDYRGQGYGIQLMMETINFAFKQLGIAEMVLGVFDFNNSAISCYKNVGFEESGTIKVKTPFADTYWNCILMNLPITKWKA
jgi:RimJ/RimL family protein N-acetyltransferase